MADKIQYQNVTATLPVEMVQYLDKLAAKRDLSRSQVLRIMIRFWQAKEQEVDQATAKQIKEQR